MTRYEFDRAIALERTSDPLVAVGTVDDAWRIGNGVNGGVLMAMGALALRQVLDEDGRHPDPLALSAYFLTPPATGPITVTTEVLRTGRSMSTAQFALRQGEEWGREESWRKESGSERSDGKKSDGEKSGSEKSGRVAERVRGLATFGDLSARLQPLVRAEPAPPMPPVEQCLPRPERSDAPDFTSTLLERMDLRLDPSCAGWLRGEPSHEGVIRAWLRFADGRDPDALSLLWALDALPPVAFDLGLMGWTPTLEFTGHVRAHPAPGWLQAVTTTANVAGGLMEEDARIWDSSGRLVALSRQLCAWRQPPAGQWPAQPGPATPG